MMGQCYHVIVANVMSSFKDEKHKHRKLKYKENVGVTSDDIISDNKNNKEGYIKADQLFYFNKKENKILCFSNY